MCRDGRLRSQRALAPASGEDSLSQAERLWRDLEQLVVADVLDRLLQAESPGGYDVRRFVCGRGAHVRELLFLGDVDVQVALTRILSDDHPLIDLITRRDHEDASLLEILHGVRSR